MASFNAHDCSNGFRNFGDDGDDAALIPAHNGTITDAELSDRFADMDSLSPWTSQADRIKSARKLAESASYSVYAMEREIKRRKAFAKMATGLASLMHDDASITDRTTVAELLRKLNS